MKNSKIIILAVVVIALAVVAAGVFYYLNLPKQELTTPEPQTQQTSGGNAVPETGSMQGQYAVSIENFAYSPAELVVSVGDTVTWTNKDQVKHNVASDEGNELAGPLLAQNESYSHTFNAPGIYAYHCTPHPFMKAKIIVQ
jgi:amicyanin